MRTLRFYSMMIALGFAAPSLGAANLLPADQPLPQVIDHYIDAALLQENIVPASPADDATLIRRLTLDLVGRIPTNAEAKAYVESIDPLKKAKLVDRLIASAAFARHQSVMFEAMMPSSSKNDSGGLRDYFQRALEENRPWSQIFRELLVPDENDAKQKGASDFLKARVADLDKLTIDVSVTFFGVNVSCAQCHDHPLVNDWKQDHFYGMKTFFSRTFASGSFIGEREFGLVKFIPTKGAEKQAKPIFLTGKLIDLPNLREPSAEEQKQEKQRTKNKTEGGAPTAPAVSARRKLVEAALQDGNSVYFNKSIVNRLWHRFLGFGLVNPLDQMHSENPPSHPELLEWLARDTAAHQYDIRRLTRGIVLSETYARDSKYHSTAQPDPKFFAVARLKPLMPLQLAMSLRVATSDPTAFESMKPADVEKKIDQFYGSARGFAAQIAVPGDDFQIGVNEALLFSNSGKVVQEFLSDGQGTLLGRVKEITDTKKALELIVRSVMGRPIRNDELETLDSYVQKRPDRQADAYRQIVWALISSSEFRFNH